MSNGGGGSPVALREEQAKAMPDSEYMPSGVDPATPSVARMYDYYRAFEFNREVVTV